jgi:hypothetical protein
MGMPSKGRRRFLSGKMILPSPLKVQVLASNKKWTTLKSTTPEMTGRRKKPRSIYKQSMQK